MAYKNKREGYSAFCAGLSGKDNPHKAGTLEHSDWARGWVNAAREEVQREEPPRPAPTLPRRLRYGAA